MKTHSRAISSPKTLIRAGFTPVNRYKKGVSKLLSRTIYLRTCIQWISTFLVFCCFLSRAEASQLNQGDQSSEYSEYVDVELQGQFGNQLFQIAAAYAYSLDNRIPLVIPELPYKS